MIDYSEIGKFCMRKKPLVKTLIAARHGEGPGNELVLTTERSSEKVSKVRYREESGERW